MFKLPAKFYFKNLLARDCHKSLCEILYFYFMFFLHEDLWWQYFQNTCLLTLFSIIFGFEIVVAIKRNRCIRNYLQKNVKVVQVNPWYLNQYFLNAWDVTKVLTIVIKKIGSTRVDVICWWVFLWASFNKKHDYEKYKIML